MAHQPTEQAHVTVSGVPRPPPAPQSPVATGGERVLPASASIGAFSLRRGRSSLVIGLLLFTAALGVVMASAPRQGQLSDTPESWTGAAWGVEVSHWELSTGSTIGYTRFAPADPIQTAPVLFLHGGPAGDIAAQDGDFARELTNSGFEVYLFDHAGVGWSESIDIDDATIDQMVADVEAIRVAIGAEQLHLIGHGWGGSLATHYTVAHGDRVQRAWLSNPGAYRSGGFAPQDRPEESP